MNKKQLVIVSGIVLLLAILAIVLGVWMRDDPDVPPDPLIVTSAGDAGTYELEAGEEDAEVDAEVEAGPSGKNPGKTDPRLSKFIACCRVLANNAKSVADPLARASMTQAAAVCEASARSGKYDAVDGILTQYKVPCN